MNTVIEVNNVSKTFGKNTNLNRVLDEACMYVAEGEFVSLMGASGSGKSTLLYLIGGLDRDFEGKITLCGKDIGSLKDKQLSDLRLKNVGFVFQFYNLVMNLNVADNILLPQTLNGKTNASLKDELDEILELTGLTDKKKAMPATLSGGQQQRVAIARAVMGNPAIILADEPTGNLDAKSSQEVMELFSKLNKEKGLTILQVTHSERCASYGTRIIKLEDGKTIG
ncbi:MAG: ABC transporter ATP-binding protein [Clostridiales bacterium]|nr:ABC transporter ATP-binding protein [Clostridiales bacterium]MBR6986587.1 ABC transporter ATP-binding protein [Clostridiales bacterium]